MKKCAICGMVENQVHAANYKGIGKHPFTEPSSQKAFSGEITDDIIVFGGGELKSMGDGKFEGYLVRFSSADDPDLTGDFFTKSTEFYIEDGTTIPILYDHGLNATIKGRKIGRAKVSYDDVGLFIKGELELRDAFEQAINDKLIKLKKAGLSSGAARHMTQRRQVRKGVSEVIAWGIAEGSITVAPTEPRNDVVSSLKSYAEDREDAEYLFEGLELKSDVLEVDDDPTAYGKEHAFEPEPDEPTECAVCGEEFGEGVHTKSASTIKKYKQHNPHQFVSSEDDEDTCLNCEQSYEDGKHTNPKKSFQEDEDSEIIHRSLKGMFDEELAAKTPSIWELRQTFDSVCGKIAVAANTSDITGVEIDIEGKVTEAATELAAREIPLVVQQIKDWLDRGGRMSNSMGCSSPESNYFYLKSVPLHPYEQMNVVLESGTTLSEHSTKVVSAVEGFVKLAESMDKSLKTYLDRFQEKIEFRANDPLKSGRVISSATVEKLRALREVLKPISEYLGGADEKISTLLELANSKKLAQTEDPMVNNQNASAETNAQTVDQSQLLNMQLDLARQQTADALAT